MCLCLENKNLGHWNKRRTLLWHYIKGTAFLVTVIYFSCRTVFLAISHNIYLSESNRWMADFRFKVLFSMIVVQLYRTMVGDNLPLKRGSNPGPLDQQASV